MKYMGMVDPATRNENINIERYLLTVNSIENRV